MTPGLRMAYMPTIGRAMGRTLSSDPLIFYGGGRCRLLRFEDSGQLSTISDAELAVRRVEMAFDGPHRKNQAPGNLGVGQTMARQGRNFLLPPGQHGKAGRLGQRRDERDLAAGLSRTEAGGLGPCRHR